MTCNTTSTLLDSTVFTRNGYGLLGWATSSTATEPTYTPGQSISTNILTTTTGANASLYAVWQPMGIHVYHNGQ